MPTYSYRWLTLLLSAELASRPLIAIWDYILSERPTTRESVPKVDALLDICTAMLLLAKRPMLAGPTAERNRNGTMWIPVDSLDDEASSMFALELLRNYPIGEVGGVSEILRVAWQVRQQRLLAEFEGEGPDDIQWEEEEEAQISSGRSRLEEVADVVRSRIAASAPSAADISRTLQDSDAAASIAKASTNLTAAALARWKAAPTLGSLWSTSTASSTTPPSTVSMAPTSDLSSRLAALTLPASAPGADLYRRDTSMPPSFISPRGSIVYPAGRYRRRGGDSLGIGNRLSSLVEQIHPPATPPAATKPLLLSGSARAASTYAGGSTSPGHVRSPSSAHSLDVSVNLGRPLSLGRTAQAGSEPSTTSARLRRATADASIPIHPHDHARVALSDPGSGDVPDQAGTDYHTDSTTGITKYQLTDLPVGIPDLRQYDSSDSQVDPIVVERKPSAGIARRQVVRKGRIARPPNLKFTDGPGLERNSSASTVESRHHSIDAGIAESLASSRTPVRADFLNAPPPPGDEVPKETAPRNPRSPRMSGASPRRHAKQLDKVTAPRPTSDGALADAESNDESEGHALREQDGYGDLLESYGSIADF